MENSIITASAARTNLYKIIDEVAMSHTPKTITGKRNNAVILSQSDWIALQETLYLVSIPKMRTSIQEGMDIPLEQCTTEIDWS